MLQVEMPDQIFSGSFNYDGSRFVCTCKDKKLRVLDSHSGNILQVSYTLVKFLVLFWHYFYFIRPTEV